MDPALELRKLNETLRQELINILENDQGWKRLMSVINIPGSRPKKYNSNHMALIEDRSKVHGEACTALLFHDWGVTGRIRPTLQTLLCALTEAKLSKAADVLRSHLNLRLAETANGNPLRTEAIEGLLEDLDYPRSALDNASNQQQQQTVDANINYSTLGIPREPPAVVVTTASASNNVSVGTPVGISSDLIKFSQSLVANSVENNDGIPRGPDSSIAIDSGVDNRPMLSSLLNHDSEANSEAGPGLIPDFSALNMGLMPNINSSYGSVLSSNSTGSNLSDNDSSTTQTESSLTQSGSTSENLTQSENCSGVSKTGAQAAPFPNLSALNQTAELSPVSSGDSSSTSNTRSTTDTSSRSSHITTSTHNTSSLNVPVSRATSSSLTASIASRPCVSPLPNLSLNTHLTHFSYHELTLATNHFDETPVQANGRFLGAGAFGKVYLASGLQSLEDKHVAVKKLILDTAQVTVDDAVTRQFRNEVEVLSRYQHENLLSLLGYSCDGCTYCLLYEYVPGGALKDRLQRTDSKLVWTKRMEIARGTARAVSYLHSAFSTTLVHRDIKTANILLDSSDNPKLSDFGLVKLLSPNKPNTSTASSGFGTSAYMSPEAFRGDVSQKLDTFSFGVVLLELLTSLPPMDDNREGNDLVTHILDTYDSEIEPILDRTVGSWEDNGVNFAAELFSIALNCLMEKRSRPTMKDVSAELEDLVFLIGTHT